MQKKKAGKKGKKKGLAVEAAALSMDGSEEVVSDQKTPLSCRGSGRIVDEKKSSAC